MKESDIMRHCILEVSRQGGIVWRNNVGAARTVDDRYIKFGVCNPGGADLIGIYRGKFLALEIKQPGKNPTPEQRNFIEMIRKHGGIAGVCREAADVKKILNGELTN